MYALRVGGPDEGCRLDKYLLKYFDAVPAAFIYRHLRKKNIKLNNRKAAGNEKLKSGDEVELYFSTASLSSLGSFFAPGGGTGSGKVREKAGTGTVIKAGTASFPEEPGKFKLDDFCSIVYEDENIIIADKKAGVLSQKAGPSDISLNEALLLYVRRENAGMEQDGTLKAAPFTPSICNRIDKNTTGLVVFAKTYMAAREINTLIRERSIKKYYLAIAEGVVKEPVRLNGWLIKDEKLNKVSVGKEKKEGSALVETVITPIKYLKINTAADNAVSCLNLRNGGAGDKLFATLLKAELITGKPHQIRAQLAAAGHPLLGDIKYGHKETAAFLKKKYGIKRQLLHAWKLEFPEEPGKPPGKLSGKSFEAAVPKDMGLLTGGI